MKEVQYDKITNVIVQGIDMKDFPDFCDAYIESCDIDGIPATEEQLEFINQNGMFVHEKVWEALH